MEKIFTNIYENAAWGNNNNSEYNGSSGGGSEVNYNINTYIPLLKKFILDNNIKKVIDIGCGDFKCGQYIYDDLDMTYIGYDVYDKIIQYNNSIHSKPKYTFNCLDVFGKKEDIESGDLCILKDILQHWELKNIYTFLDYLTENKKFKYIIITNCCGQYKDNQDLETVVNGRPLSCNFLPLRKYNPIKLCNYYSKEVSVIIT